MGAWLHSCRLDNAGQCWRLEMKVYSLVWEWTVADEPRNTALCILTECCHDRDHVTVATTPTGNGVQGNSRV